VKVTEARVESIRSAGAEMLVLRLSTDLARESAPGTFVNVKVPGAGMDPFLRRPFSVYWTDRASGTLELLVQVRGKGTRALSRLREGDALSLLGPLGKGFPVERISRAPAVDLLAGGCGAAPLVFLARELKRLDPDLPVRLFVGARTHSALPEPNVVAERAANVVFATEDGSLGFHGDVLSCVRKERRAGAVLCACGPTAMLEALRKWAVEQRITCFLSLETFMACGFGVCKGCVVADKNGTYVTVCRDGPVFDADLLGPLRT